MDCNLNQQVRFQASEVCSIDITHLSQLYLFRHIARASPEDDRLSALMAEIMKLEAGWKRLKGLRRKTLTHDPELLGRPCTTEYRQPLEFEKGSR